MNKNYQHTPSVFTSGGNKFSRAALLLFIALFINSVNVFAARTSKITGGGNAAATVCGPGTDVLLFTFDDAQGSTATKIAGVNFTTSGTAVSGTDITDFKVWYNTTTSFTGATLIGSITSGLGAGAHSLTFTATSLPTSATVSFFITATIPSTATNGSTIVFSGFTHAANVPLVFSGTAPTYSGSASASGTQTIKVVTPILGGTQNLCGSSTAVTTFSDATSGGIWSSSNTAVATVAAGTVTGLSNGSATISYTIGTCSATLPVSYSSTTPAAITGPSTVCPSTVGKLLFSEGFESGTFPPAGWTYTGSIWNVVKPSTVSGYPAPSAAQAGTYMAQMNFYNISSSGQFATPVIDMSNVSNGVLSLWVYRNNDYYYSAAYGFGSEGVTVYINTTNVPAGGTTLGFIPRAADGVVTGSFSGISTPYTEGWYQYTVNIPPTYNGATNYLVFKATSQYGDNMFMDNILLKGDVYNSINLTDATAGGTWASSNTGVASVSASGVVTGLSTGTATISYSNSCGAATKNVSVLSPVTAATTNVCPSTTITLSDATTGGAWTSSNTAIATVNSSTGIVTGVATGTALISYSLDAGCYIPTVVTVNPPPAPVSGGPSICLSRPLTFADATLGGTWSSSNAAVASVNATTGSVTTSALGTATITYKLPTGCIALVQATVNPVPAPIVSSGYACIPDVNNAPVTLTDATPLGTWSSSNPAAATIASGTGLLTGVALGSATITYALTATGCSATQDIYVRNPPAAIAGNTLVCANVATVLSDATLGGLWSSSNAAIATADAGTGIITGQAGSIARTTALITYTLPTGCRSITTVSVDPLPAAATGIPSVCEGSTTTLTSATSVTWSSSNTGLATVSSSGVVTGVVAGTLAISYTATATGCSAIAPVTVNAVPAAITSATRSLCYGSSLTLNNISAGGTWSTSSAIAVVDGAGVVTATGTVTAPVMANIDYSFTNGCKATRVITVNPLPVVYNLLSPTGTSAYCAGDAGVDLALTAATPGINYTLYADGVPVGVSLATAGTVDFGNQTAAGTYTATARDKATGCASNMTGSPVISINLPPVQHTLTYTGPRSSYCDGAAGVDVTLDNSQSGVDYTLNLNTVPGSVLPGSGSALDFGNLPEGVYTATAENTVTHCKSDMLGNVVVVKDPLPVVYDVTVQDSGHYCAGGTGAYVGVTNGNAGIAYELYDATPTLLATIDGANAGIDFGLKTVGTYTVRARNKVTGCTSNMNGSANVSTLPLPRQDTVTGTGGYCPGGAGVPVAVSNSVAGVSYQLLRASVAVGSAVPGTGGKIDFGPQFIGGNYTVYATNDNTGCAQAMYSSANVIAYPALKIDTVVLGNNGNYCQGTAGVDVSLSGSDTGVIYNIWKNGAPSVMVPVIGTGGPVTFPEKDSVVGVTTIVATSLGAGGCQAAMQGSPVVVASALPVPQDVTVTNGGFYCAGGTGVNIGLNFSAAGITYELFMGSVTTGRVLAGGNSGLDFGTVLPAGTYGIIATDNATHCTNNMSESVDVTINPLPVAYNITGGGSYCIGTTTGKQVGLYSSQSSISYQLFNGATQSGSAVTGTGSAVDFGYQLATGLYTVYGTNTVTGCINKMTGSTVITKDSLPAQFTVTGGGDYCAGGAGKVIGLDNSVTGVNYQLMGSTGVAAMVPGTGSAIDFGSQTGGGTYTVLAATVVSGCTNTMLKNAVININALPAADTLLGGGTACAGSAGVAVYMAHTVPGINYQLYNAGAPVGAATPGTGSSLALGSQTTGGAYTVIAQNPATGCENTMTGTATVTINPLPLSYTITGGGTMCAGGTGFTVALGGSQPGVSYTLSGAAIPVTLAGTGAALDFGRQTSGGIYTIQASDIITGCANTMTGTATVNVNPAPAPFAISGGGNYCIGGAGVLVGLGGSESGINYQLYNGTVATGTPVGGTGSSISFGRQTAAGTAYTVRAVNTTSTCGSDMTGSVPVIIDTLGIPTVKINNSDSSCIGAVEHYTVTSTFTGTAPAYLWKIGSTVVSATSTYDVIPANGDVVSVELTSNAACIATTKAKDALTVSAIPYSTPTAAITATPGDNVCHGTAVTVSAITTFGGSLSAGSWLRNGVYAGTGTTFSYTPNSGNTGDVITYLLHSNYRCRSADSVYSNAVVMTVDTAVMPVFDLTAHTGPLQSIGTSDQTVGQIDTFTAGVTSSSAYTYAYQWYIQGTPVPGATNNVYIDHSVYNNDEISCEVTKTGACSSQSATKKITVKLKNVGVQQVLATTSDISILPNPNKGSFIVKGTLGSSANEEATLELTNMLGQVVYSKKVSIQGGTINEQVQVTSTLANGMYLLNVRAAGAVNVFHVVIEQ